MKEEDLEKPKAILAFEIVCDSNRVLIASFSLNVYFPKRDFKMHPDDRYVVN